MKVNQVCDVAHEINFHDCTMEWQETHKEFCADNINFHPIITQDGGDENNTQPDAAMDETLSDKRSY